MEIGKLLLEDRKFKIVLLTNGNLLLLDPITSGKFCKTRSIYGKRTTHKYLCPLMPPIELLIDLPTSIVVVART